MKRSSITRKTPLKSNGFARADRIEAREVAKAIVKEKKLRTRKCSVKTCRKEFAPRSMTHKTCGPECAQEFVRLEKIRTDRKERQAGLAKLKTRQDWLREAQAAFNAFIRARDAALPCISCGRFHDGKYDAGHYRSVGAMPALRFHELNVHKQCVPCNQHKGGNIVEYRIGLIARIGVESVEMLEQDYPPAKYTIDDAKEIRAHYKKLLKELSAAA